MQSEHTLSSELEILQKILGAETQSLPTDFPSQLKYLFSKINGSNSSQNKRRDNKKNDKPEAEKSSSTQNQKEKEIHWQHKAIQKILMKILILQDAKNLPLNKTETRLFQRESALAMENFVLKSSLKASFTQVVKKFLQAKKFAKNPRATILLASVSWFRDSIREPVIKEAKGILANLEKKKAVLSPAYLPFLDEKFITTEIVSLTNKLLRKSMKNLPKIHRFLAALKDLNHVDQAQKTILSKFLGVLESNLCNALTKEASLQKEVFSLGGLLLSSLSEFGAGDEKLSQSILTFLNNCKTKLKIKKDDALMLKYADLLTSVKGNHSVKVAAAVVDGLWIALENTKDEDARKIITSKMFMLYKITSLDAVGKAIAPKLKVKKDVLLAAPVMMSYLSHFDLFRLSSSSQNPETSVFEKLKNLSVSLKSSLGVKSEEILKNFSENMSLNFANFHSLLHAGFYYTLSKVLSENLENQDDLPELPSKLPDLISQLSDFCSNKNKVCNLNSDPLISKLLKILFKKNSMIYRNSLFEQISAWDALALLRLIRLLQNALSENFKDKKISDSASLLVYNLILHILNSDSRNLLFTRGKYVRLVSSLKSKNKLPQLGELCVRSLGVHTTSSNLLSDFLIGLLVRGAFISATGTRFSLDIHRNLQDVWSLCKYQNVNLLGVLSNTDSKESHSGLPLSFQLAWMQSIVDFDFELSASLPERFDGRRNDLKNRLVDMITNLPSSITLGDFKSDISQLLAPIEKFMSTNGDAFEDFWCRIFSGFGLFSYQYTTRLFAGRLLALMTCIAPSVLVPRLKWLLSPVNMRKLTRIKKIINHIATKDCESTATETSRPEHFAETMCFLLKPLYSAEISNKAMSWFGERDPENMTATLESKNFPSSEELLDDRPDLFEFCAEQAGLEETEEENMAGLELLPEKELVLSSYRHVLHCLTFYTSQVYELSSYMPTSCQSVLATQFRTLQPNLLSNANDSGCLLRSSLRPVFENVYKLSCRGNGMDSMVSLFYNILQGNITSEFRQKLEKTCEALETRDSYVETHLFGIFFRTLQYLVDQGLSAGAKKQILAVVVSLGRKFDDLYGQKVFLFLARNMNYFYFDFAFENLEIMFKDILENDDENCQSMDVLFGNLINYQEFAQKKIMNILLKLKDKISVSKMKISPLNKLKLRFLSEDVDSEVIQQAQSLLQCQNLKFDMSSFEELNFEEMLLDLPFDTQETFAQIFADLHSNLSAAQKASFLETLQATLKKSINTPVPNNLTKVKYERQLGLLPNILNSISGEIKGSGLFLLFESFNEVERAGYGKLTERVVSLGRELIAKNPSKLGRLISAQASQIRASEPLISPIVFVAECAKVNPHLASQVSDLEDDLKRLLAVDDKDFLQRLAKQIRHLTAFIKEPENWFRKLFKDVMDGKAGDSLLGNCYFCAGLLKGLGVRFMKSFGLIEKMEKPFLYSVKKDYKDVKVKVRMGCSLMAEALWDVFDRLLEPSLKDLLQFLIKLLGDSKKEVRDLTRLVMNKVMGRISEFGIKRILPVLLNGAADKNSKTKYNAILALGSIANCGTRQLSKNLPTIVPTLTHAINDTNEQVNSAAKRSLSLILGTIRNPEVSSLRDVLIKSLSDPFNHNERALEALLKTRFAHSLDGPSLSLIVPIALYGCKEISTESSKIKSAQLIASMINLVPEPKEFLPHLEPLLAALTENLKDLNSEVRAMAAKAFAALSKKFKDETGMQLLNSLKNKLESEDANSTERAGFAQAFAEVLVSLGLDVTKELLPKALQLTRDSREHIRESFLSVFVYLPMVMGEAFVDYVAVTIESIVESIAHEKERIRNLSIKSLKIIIQGYLQNQFQVLLRPLFEGSISLNPNKRNSSLILLGDIIQMLMGDATITTDYIYQNYARIFSLFYIAKNDDDSEVRETAKNIYKTFVPNTQRCLRIIYKDLHDCFIDLFSREQEAVRMTASRGLKEFGNKFADTFAAEMLTLSRELLNQRLSRHSEILGDPEYTKTSSLVREVHKLGTLLSGQSVFITQFVAKCNNAALFKIKKTGLLDVNARCCDFNLEKVWKEAFAGLRIFVERSGDVSGLVPRVERYSTELTAHEALLAQRSPTYQASGTLEEGELSDSEYEKRKKFFTIMLNSSKEAILRTMMNYLFKGSQFSEWQFEVILQNLKLFGDLLYENGVLKAGLSTLFECYKNKHAELKSQNKLQSSQRPNFLTTNQFTINMLAVNIDQANSELLIDELLCKLNDYQSQNNSPMLLVTLNTLSYFFEKTPLTDSQFPLALTKQVLNLSSYTGEGFEDVFSNSGKLLEILFRLYDRETCPDVMYHISETIKSLIESKSSYAGLSVPSVFACIMKLMLEVLATATPDSAIQALDTADFLLTNLSVELFKPHESTLYASLLRVLIYRYRFKRESSNDLKQKIFTFLEKLLEAKLDMGHMRSQYMIYLVFLSNSQYKTSKAELAQKKTEKKEPTRIEKEGLDEEKEAQTDQNSLQILQEMPLLAAHFRFMERMGVDYSCLIGLVSQWGRKVGEDSDYYLREPLQIFVEMLEASTSSSITSGMKADLKRLVP